MRALLVLAAALMLACCATSPEDDAHVCEVVRATPHATEFTSDNFDLTNWQSIALRSNRTDCVETRLQGIFYRYPQIGFSTSGDFAIVLVNSGSGHLALEGSRCYLRRERDAWQLVGCTREWEF
ncbi:MAG: hypothetical protein NT015_11195 [Alphaproteobacteria bacterium]|nr:hypothetical protein [Alphaproteobacteria bacterium]